MRLVCAAAGGALLILTLGGAAAAQDLIERGAYLVETIGACGNCHTPKDATGGAVTGRELSGGAEFDDPGLGHIVGPNITPDVETGIGRWSPPQIATALRDGKRPNGSIIAPPMPIPAYRQLSDHDAAAIAAYLRTVMPLRHAVGKSQYKVALPPSYGPPVEHVADPPQQDRIAYGGYLAAAVGHCVLCHTAPGGGKPVDMSRAYGGGRELPDFAHPGALTVSRNITPDPEHGIGKWTDADIKRSIVEGVRPDGTRLTRTMPFDSYAKMTADDLDAIVAFLRTLKPVQ